MNPTAARILAGWELLALVESRGHGVAFVKVRGHADRLARTSTERKRYNQLCDELAIAAVPV